MRKKNMSLSDLFLELNPTTSKIVTGYLKDEVSKILFDKFLKKYASTLGPKIETYAELSIYEQNFNDLILSVAGGDDINALATLINIYNNDQDFREPLSFIPHLAVYSQIKDGSLSIVKNSLPSFDLNKLIDHKSFVYFGFNALHMSISAAWNNHEKLYPYIKMLCESGQVDINGVTKNNRIMDKTPLQMIAYEASTLLDSASKRMASIKKITKCLITHGADIEPIIKTKTTREYSPQIIKYVEATSEEVSIVNQYNSQTDRILRNSHSIFCKDAASIISQYATVTDFDELLEAELDQEGEKPGSGSKCVIC